jgi:hypothetical protein
MDRHTKHCWWTVGAGVIIAGASFGMGLKNYDRMQTLQAKVPQGVLELEAELEKAEGETLQQTIENVLADTSHYQEVVAELNTNYDMEAVRVVRDTAARYENNMDVCNFGVILGGLASLVGLYSLTCSSAERYVKRKLEEINTKEKPEAAKTGDSRKKK